ncbi:type 2 periplasmic-binding domain-containing protein [Paenibacillus cymbidii]|uniref:extracellular solute-binding protein n=1 Tax=Paenibacillus cymbidii TaxID=1639034 RepID=UPI001080630B|nr:extracellular solute-binding protein [Paenibacillus cymbidii]
MSKRRKIIASSVVSTCLFGVILAGCSSGNSSSGSSSSPAASATASAKPMEDPNAKKIEMTMFMGNAGVPDGPGIDPSDNPFINIVEKYANVDLKLDIPPYADFQKRHDLLLASGKLPDIVHSYYPDTIENAADQGAFIDLKKYYDNSPAVKRLITPEQMELAKSASGHYYRIPMSTSASPTGSWLQARYDLVEKYNAGKWPTSVDEWVELIRKINAANPGSTLISNAVNGDTIFGQGANIFYSLYGAPVYGQRVAGGKVMSTFVLPEYRKATELMRQLYSEGIVDKEFATNNSAKFNTNMYDKNMIGLFNAADGVVSKAQGLKVEQEQTKNFKMYFAPPLTTYPTDEKYVWPYKQRTINTHGLYISASSKNPDRAWKVIEGFASKELQEAIFWGSEGVTYTVKDGKRILDPDKLIAPDRKWSSQLALISGYTSGGVDAKKNVAEQLLGADYAKAVYDSLDPIGKLAEKKGYKFSDFYKGASNEANMKMTEMKQFISTATVQAIMGAISMSDFDKKVTEFNTKYGFIFDEMTKYLTEHKAELLKLGVFEAGW